MRLEEIWVLFEVLAGTLLAKEETIVLLDKAEDDGLVIESWIEDVLEVDDELRPLGEEFCVLACTVICTVIVSTVVELVAAIELTTVVDFGRVIVVAAGGGTGVIPNVIRSPPAFEVEAAAADIIERKLSTEVHREK